MTQKTKIPGKIGFIGTGKMAEAIIAAIFQEQKNSQIYGIEPSAKRKQELEKKYNIIYPQEASYVIKNCNPIFLAVKPQNIEDALGSVEQFWRQTDPKEQKILISILAGTNTKKIATLVSEDISIVRVMPNTPAIIGKGIQAVSFPKEFSENQKEKIFALLKGLGSSIEIEEHLMNAVTALSGSGPAYVYSFVQGLIDGGVHAGLTREIARTLTLETLLGTAALLKESREEPYKLRSDVTSPGGTTIAGLKVLQENAFEGTLINAIESACQRAQELESNFHDHSGCDGSCRENPELSET